VTSKTRLAHPLVTISEVETRARFAAIGTLIGEWRPVLLVVGLPSRTDGTEHR
jgi:putative Holliday junction resolvase